MSPELLAKAAQQPTASAFDPARSTILDAETTETRKVFRNPSDGSTTALISMLPARFKDSSGKWVENDLSLVPAADGSLKAKAAKDSTTVGASAGQAAAKVDTQAGVITARHPGASESKPNAARDTATYKGALAGRDLQIALTLDGFEESVVLADRSQAASYTVEFVLPTGVTARQVDAGIEFIDGSGSVVARYGSGIAFDANGANAPVEVKLTDAPADERAAPATTTTTTTTATSVPPTSTTVKGSGTTSTTAKKGESPATTTMAAPKAADERVARVEVSTASDWARDPARAYPLVIDPSFTTTAGAASSAPGWGYDTIVQEAAPTTPGGTHPYLYGHGTTPGRIRSLLWFDLDRITPPAPNVSVVNSYLQLWPVQSSDCVARPLRLALLGAAFTEATTWSNQPALTADATNSHAFAAGYPCQSPSSWVIIDTTSLAKLWMSGERPNQGMALMSADEAQPSGWRAFSSGNSSTPPYFVVTWGHQADESVPVAPADHAVLTTNTPVLQVAPLSDPDGADDPTTPLQAWFRVSTHPGETGPHTVDTGWLNTTTHQIPEGVLQDGQTYYWHVYTGDQTTETRRPTWVRSFTVDMGAGGAGAHPRDPVGPVSVDLANGNLVTTVATPAVSTPSGPLGVSLTYNSKLPTVGLRGDYYVDTGDHVFETKSPVMVRTDPAMRLWWVTERPGPLVPPGQLLGRWTGTLRVPESGDYQFGVNVSGGVRITIDKPNAGGGHDEVVVYDHWEEPDFTYPEPRLDPPTSLTVDTVYPIKVEYYSADNLSFISLFVKRDGQLATNIPSSWLSPDAHEPLPAGWTLSASQPYVAARVGEQDVTFTDAGGNNHVYTWTGSGYAPTPGEDGVVSLDPSGRVTLHEGSRSYVFDAWGRLVVSNGYTDNVKISASTCWGWDDDGRLRVIHDRDSNQFVTLSYQGQDLSFTTPCSQTLSRPPRPVTRPNRATRHRPMASCARWSPVPARPPTSTRAASWPASPTPATGSRSPPTRSRSCPRSPTSATAPTEG
ncbi:MAG: DNRLRE domain-containing protein [Acidimicrobiales bacterium]